MTTAADWAKNPSHPPPVLHTMICNTPPGGSANTVTVEINPGAETANRLKQSPHCPEPPPLVDMPPLVEPPTQVEVPTQVEIPTQVEVPTLVEVPTGSR